MTRFDNDRWNCIICGREVVKKVICSDCEYFEMDKQKSAPSSITGKQIWYMETHLFTKLDSQTTINIILQIVPNYDYDLGSLSTNQGKSIIAKLLDAIEHKEVSHEKAMD